MSGALATGLAGGVSLIGGWRKEGKWPANGYRAVIATVCLVLLMNVLDGTQAAPVARGLSYLLLLSAVFVTVGSWNSPTKKASKK